MPIDSHPRSHPEDRNEGNLNHDPVVAIGDPADEFDLSTDIATDAIPDAEAPTTLPSREARNPEAVMAEEAGSPPGMGPEEWDRIGSPDATRHGPSGEAGDDDGAGNPSPRESLERYGSDDVDGIEMTPDWVSGSAEADRDAADV
jgi:hypothetical protein